MKTFILTLLSFYLGISFIFSQEKAKVEIGNAYPDVEADNKLYFKNEGNIITLKENTLQLLDIEKMKPIKTAEYALPKDAEYEEICEFDGNYILFYSIWDKENEYEQLFYKNISSDIGKIDNEGKLIFKVKGKISGNLVTAGILSFKVVNKFNFKYSQDKSKLLIQYTLKQEKPMESNIGFYIFSQGLEKVLSYELKAPMCLDYLVDDAGNLLIYTYLFNNNDTKLVYVGNKPNIHLEILKITANSNSITNIPLNFDDKFVGQIWISEFNSENILGIGFTNQINESDKKDAKTMIAMLNNSDGLSMLEIGKTGKVSDLTNYPIPLEIINQYEDDRTKKKNEKKEKEDKAEFQDIKLNKVIVQNDGSVVIIGEQQFEEIITTTYVKRREGSSLNDERETNSKTYHYNNILITKIDHTGQLLWMKKLPKKQTGKERIGGMSFQYMKGNDCHYLLFLDNIDNLNLTTNDYPARHEDGKGGFLTAYKVNDSDGKVSKISILDTRNVKEGMGVTDFVVNKIIPISTNSFIFEVNKTKKENILIKVTL